MEHYFRSFMISKTDSLVQISPTYEDSFYARFDPLGEIALSENITDDKAYN